MAFFKNFAYTASERVFYLIESIRGGKIFWIILMYRSSYESAIYAVISLNAEFVFQYSILWISKRNVNSVVWETEKGMY